MSEEKLSVDEEIKLGKKKFKAMLECYRDAIEPLITMRVNEHPISAELAMTLVAAAFPEYFQNLEKIKAIAKAEAEAALAEEETEEEEEGDDPTEGDSQKE